MVLVSAGFPEERRDFSITPVDVVFQPDDIRNLDLSVPFRIFNDSINEPEEDFVVLLEIRDAVNPAAVNLDFRNASVCRIIDDDGMLVNLRNTS